MGDVSAEFAVRVSSEQEARAWVRARSAKARENFSVMSGFVPRPLRDDFAAVYAFCRVSDDLADETGADESARERSRVMLAEWREMVVGAHSRAMQAPRESGPRSGPPTHPIMLALEGAIARHKLAQRHFTDLLDAFEEDQRVTRWASLADLKRYSTRSANPVGRLVLGLFGVADEADETHASRDLFAASDALCTALQLTNLWQDIRRDLFERDRIYVPCEEIGLDARQLEEWIRAPRTEAARHAFARAMREPHRATRDLFEQGRAVIDLAPPAARRVLSLFWHGGASTLDRVIAAQGGELWKRPRLSSAAKAWLVAREILGVNRGTSPARSGVARA